MINARTGVFFFIFSGVGGSVVRRHDDAASWALAVESMLRRLEATWWPVFLKTPGESHNSPSLVARGRLRALPFGIHRVLDALTGSSQRVFFGHWLCLPIPYFTAFRAYTKKFLVAAAQNFLPGSAHGVCWLGEGLGSSPRTSAYFGRAGFEVKYAFPTRNCSCVGSILPSLMQYPVAYEYVNKG